MLTCISDPITSKRSYKVLKGLIPQSWVVDPAPLPPGAVIDGPVAQGKPLHHWMDLAEASQKERNLVLKISGFHETAWGSRSVVIGNDVSREDWTEALQEAVDMAPTHLHVLQYYLQPPEEPCTGLRKPDPALRQFHYFPLKNLCLYRFVHNIDLKTI